VNFSVLVGAGYYVLLKLIFSDLLIVRIISRSILLVYWTVNNSGLTAEDEGGWETGVLFSGWRIADA